MDSYERFKILNQVMRQVNAPFRRQMIANTRQSGARFSIEYTAKTRKTIIDAVLNIQHECERVGKLLGMELSDSANYFERNEQVFRRSASIISCKNFDEVEDLTPVTHGSILIEIQF